MSSQASPETRHGHADGPFLATARGRKASRRPLWIMRQAGRYLPEYREIRQRYSFLELCKSPQAAAEVTLQPVERFDLDAAILFTDLLIPVEAMGVGLSYEPAPVLAKTIATMADVEALHVLDPGRDLTPMLDTVRLVREKLPDDKALIGFVGAPFTLACYLVEGCGSKTWDRTRRMLHGEPQLFDALLQRLVHCTDPLIHDLVQHGCDAVQVFDSWASVLSADDYAQRCAPHTNKLLESTLDTGAVAINYVNGAAQHLETMARSRAHVLGFDWRIPMARAREVVPADKTLQGNLDPTALFAKEPELRRMVRDICDAAGPQRHIFNLGHGILPETDPGAVAIVVDEVRSSP
ncbi:MAG: uroporphyrinogen decarboxylase [Planctomycetota bacterium]|jgi:uroporphyrinogen decarboxylase